MQLAQYSQKTVPAGGLNINLGNAKGWLSIVVDTVAGQSTGTGITISLGGFKVYESFTLAYGAPALTLPFKANRVNITGSGAVIELIIDTEHVVVSPVVLTPGTVNVGNNVSVTDAAVEASTGALAGLIYPVGTTPPGSALAAGLTDPPQVAVTGGKAVPVKTET